MMATDEKRWECSVCGYIHIGPQPPEVCPLCGAPASEFHELPPEEADASTTPKTASASSASSSALATSPSAGVTSCALTGPGQACHRTVADIMVETMVNWGITHVFGMIGHSSLYLADSIRCHCQQGRLHYIGIRHEGAAAFAASAYGKLTGRPAACLTIAGPGATNLLTGLWDAKMDRVPILALTGQIDTQVLGPGAFQEVDLATAFSSVAAWSQTVLASSHHVELMNLALKHAILKRDVGHLIFPNEVQQLPIHPDEAAGTPAGRLPALDIAPPAEALATALQQLSAAERPVIIVGHGARFHMEPIQQLAERLNCPVLTTFKGKGLIGDDHPLGCGVIGRSGTLVGAHFMNSADLLLVFGASFSQHTGINPKIPTIQVDYDTMTLGKFHAVATPVYGEIGITAHLLLDQLAATGPWEDRRTAIADKWTQWRAEKQRRAQKHRDQGLNAAEVFDVLGRIIPANAVIAVDVGNNTYSFGRYFESRAGQSVLMSGYLGSIGFGFPAAMGAWAAAPDRPIIALTGDGGFSQYMAELCTAVKYRMNITHILLNNQELGKITKEQETAHLDVWETDLHNPNFARYAENCGALGIRIDAISQLPAALEKALAYAGPALIEIISDARLS